MFFLLWKNKAWLTGGPVAEAHHGVLDSWFYDRLIYIGETFWRKIMVATWFDLARLNFLCVNTATAATSASIALGLKFIPFNKSTAIFQLLGPSFISSFIGWSFQVRISNKLELKMSFIFVWLKCACFKARMDGFRTHLLGDPWTKFIPNAFEVS